MKMTSSGKPLVGDGLRLGHGVERKTTVIALDWNRAQLDRHKTIKDVFQEDSGPQAMPGVYAIEGRHDASRDPHILYIGSCGANEHAGQSLRERTRQSLEHVLRSTHFDSEPSEWSDTWDLCLRWATVEREWVESVEKLLIRAHLPQLNSRDIRDRSLPTSHDMVVLNGGRKGPLLPVVASYYFWNKDGWSTA